MTVTAIVAIIMACIFGVCGLYVLMSLKTIQSTERGILIIFGSITRMLEPGVCFCPWLISKVKKYKVTPMIFKITVPTAITKNGKVKNYKEDGKEIEKVEVNVCLVLTTYFSKVEARLIQTAERAPGNDAKSLGPIIAPYIIDVTRAIFAEMPWVLSYQNRQKILDYITSKIIPLHPYSELMCTTTDNINTFYFEDGIPMLIGDNELIMERYNPLVQFKLDMSRTSLAITDINFCDKKLSDALVLAETARLTAEADRITSDENVQRIKDEGTANAENSKKDGLAKAEVKKREGLDGAEAARKIGFDKADFTYREEMDKVEVSKLQGEVDAEVIRKKGLATAKAREEMIKVIKDNKDLEALNALIEMAKGTSNTILYGLPAGLSDKMSSILGGNKPEDILGFLKDPAIVQTLKEAFEKITK